MPRSSPSGLATAWILPPASAGASSSGTCICHRCGDGAVHDAGGAICRSTCRNAGCKCASCCRAGLHIVVADVWLGFKIFIKSWNLNLLLGGPWVAHLAEHPATTRRQLVHIMLQWCKHTKHIHILLYIHTFWHAYIYIYIYIYIYTLCGCSDIMRMRFG